MPGLEGVHMYVCVGECVLSGGRGGREGWASDRDLEMLCAPVKVFMS